MSRRFCGTWALPGTTLAHFIHGEWTEVTIERIRVDHEIFEAGGGKRESDIDTTLTLIWFVSGAAWIILNGPLPALTPWSSLATSVRLFYDFSIDLLAAIASSILHLRSWHIVLTSLDGRQVSAHPYKQLQIYSLCYHNCSRHPRWPIHDKILDHLQRLSWFRRLKDTVLQRRFSGCGEIRSVLGDVILVLLSWSNMPLAWPLSWYRVIHFCRPPATAYSLFSRSHPMTSYRGWIWQSWVSRSICPCQKTLRLLEF